MLGSACYETRRTNFEITRRRWIVGTRINWLIGERNQYLQPGSSIRLVNQLVTERLLILNRTPSDIIFRYGDEMLFTRTTLWKYNFDFNIDTRSVHGYCVHIDSLTLKNGSWPSFHLCVILRPHYNINYSIIGFTWCRRNQANRIGKSSYTNREFPLFAFFVNDRTPNG